MGNWDYRCPRWSLPHTYHNMYKTAVYTLVNGGIQGQTSKTAKIIKRWYCPHHIDCVNVLLNNITFLWFLLFLSGRIRLTSFNSSSLKTPFFDARVSEICHTSWAIANFGSNFVAVVTRVDRGRIWLTLFNNPTAKTRQIVRRNDLGEISHINRVIDNFVSNFVAMATRVVGGKFKWYRWIGRPRKPHLRTKNYDSVLYITEVMTV